MRIEKKQMNQRRCIVMNSSFVSYPSQTPLNSAFFFGRILYLMIQPQFGDNDRDDDAVESPISEVVVDPLSELRRLDKAKIISICI